MQDKERTVYNKELDSPQTYEIQNKTFIVEPVFPKDGKETLGEVLLRLMRTDCTSL